MYLGKLGGIPLNFHDWLAGFFHLFSWGALKCLVLETARFVVGKGLMEHDEISQKCPTSTYCSECLNQWSPRRVLILDIFALEDAVLLDLFHTNKNPNNWVCLKIVGSKISLLLFSNDKFFGDLRWIFPLFSTHPPIWLSSRPSINARCRRGQGVGRTPQMCNEKRTHPFWFFFVSLFGAFLWAISTDVDMNSWNQDPGIPSWQGFNMLKNHYPQLQTCRRGSEKRLVLGGSSQDRRKG